MEVGKTRSGKLIVFFNILLFLNKYYVILYSKIEVIKGLSILIPIISQNIYGSPVKQSQKSPPKVDHIPI